LLTNSSFVNKVDVVRKHFGVLNPFMELGFELDNERVMIVLPTIL
jgi:hypothetical protein